MATFDDLADMMAGDDYAGTLEIGRARRRRGARPGYNARRLMPRVPGVPMPGVRLQPLGLGASAFTAASGAVLALTGRPQRPFKGQRLTVDITRTGASATGLLTITRLDIGTANQLVSSGALTAAAYGPQAIDNNVQLDPATPGIDVTVQFAISVVPAGADRVDFSAQINGTTIG
jgi:hypothetical protein